MTSEKQLIERIRRRFPVRSAGLRVGIGDDACIIRPGKSADTVITTDAFLENVHFRLGLHPADAVGYKALARATSDLAAMGARPLYFLLNLALPDSCTQSWLDGVLAGMSRAARKFVLVLAGGDTTRYPLASINLTVIGEVAPGRAVLRSGASPGDSLCVSGRLGGAELGLQLIERTPRTGKYPKARYPTQLVQKHLYPEPRLALGARLASAGATAMIDTSDGLSTDLVHICEASGVGARIFTEKLPKIDIPRKLQQDLGLDPLRLALHGGEDYELLFTMPATRARKLPATLLGVPVTVIGEITRTKSILLVFDDEPDGKSKDGAGATKPLLAQGWDPFRKRATHKRNKP